MSKIAARRAVGSRRRRRHRRDGWKTIFDVVTITGWHRRRLAARIVLAAPIAVAAADMPTERCGLTGVGHFKY